MLQPPELKVLINIDKYDHLEIEWNRIVFRLSLLLLYKINQNQKTIQRLGVSAKSLIYYYYSAFHVEHQQLSDFSSSCMVQQSAKDLMHRAFFSAALLRDEFRNVFSFVSSKPTFQLIPKSDLSYFSALTLPLRATHDGHADFGRAVRDDPSGARLKESPSYDTTHGVSEDATVLWQPQSQETLDPPKPKGDREVWGITRSPKQRSEIQPTTTDELDSLLSTNNSITLAKERVATALRQESSYDLVRWLRTAFQDPEYISSLRKTTITEIFHLLDPQRFLEPLKTIFKGINTRRFDERRLNTKGLEGHGWRAGQVGDIFNNHINDIRDVIQKLVTSRQSFRFQDYEMMLNTARCTGDGRAARDIWRDMLKKGVQPDTVCYNYYFEARLWPSPFDPVERDRLRITHARLRLRQFTPRSFHRHRGWDNFNGYKINRGGLMRSISHKFTDMIAQGIRADTKTFGLLMTAHAREGDLESVKKILNKVWHINVDLIMETEDNSRQLIDAQPDSPLYPTADFLFTVAHLFGTNNNLATAIRLVDHISHRFSVKVENRTWQELLHWAFILSLKRSKSLVVRGENVGQVPFKSLEWLWDIMVSDPGFDKPTMHMMDLAVRHFRCRNLPRQMLSKMIEGLKIYNVSVDRHALLFQQMTFTKWSLGSFQSQRKESKLPVHHGYNVHLAYLEERRDFSMISWWFWWLLTIVTKRFRDQDRFQQLVWERQKIPEIVEVFEPFRPKNEISYHISTGKVEIYWGKEKWPKWKNRQMRSHNDTPWLNRALRTDELQGQGHRLDFDMKRFHHQMQRPHIQGHYESRRPLPGPQETDEPYFQTWRNLRKKITAIRLARAFRPQPATQRWRTLLQKRTQTSLRKRRRKQQARSANHDPTLPQHLNAAQVEPALKPAGATASSEQHPLHPDT